EDVLDSRTVIPACRAGVPRPPAPTHVLGMRIDVGDYYIRLDLVPRSLSMRPSVIDGAQHIEELVRSIAVAHEDACDHSPGGRVGVLAAVLSYAGRIAHNVAWVVRRFVERR